MATPPKSISGLTSAAAARVMLWQSGEEVTVPGNAMGLVTTDSVSAYMLTLLDDANAAAARATLGIDEQRRNRIVNGAMQLSQETGTTGSGVNFTYFMDQWRFSFSGPTCGAQQVITIPSTITGNPYRAAYNVNTAKASFAAGDIAYTHTMIEGVNVGDLQWGTAQAKQVILRFTIRTPVAGTYCINIQNSAINRSYVAEYTISGGEVDVDVSRTIVIPGDVTGTWLKDTGIGMAIAWMWGAGTTYNNAALGWQAGQKFATTNQVNACAAVQIIHITDVGLYLDDLLTGIPPRWEMPDYAKELRACQRYFENIGMTFVTTNPPYANTSWFAATKRVSPSFTLIGGTAFGGTVQIVGYSPLNSMRQVGVAAFASDVLFAANARM